jgi:hypothetical protein
MTQQKQYTEVGKGGEGHEDEGRNLVEIQVDKKEFKIHRGHTTVAEIKHVAGVPAAYDLDQLIDGTLHTLPDNGALVIKGQEVFYSHPKGGSSS